MTYQNLLKDYLSIEHRIQLYKTIWGGTYLYDLNRIFILTHLAYRANSNKLRYIGQQFTAKVCDSRRHWKITSFMALDGVTSFLRLKDVTITCKRMRRSPNIGGSS